VNSRVEDLLGYKREEIIGKNFAMLGLINHRDVPKLLKLFVGAFKSREALETIELELKRKNGGEVSVEVGTRFIREKNGKIIGVVNIFRDITERKKAEEVLRESEERFSKTFNVNPAAISISHIADGLLVDVNETYLQLFEYSRQEVVGHTSTELNIFANPDERAKLLRFLQKDGVVRHLEIPLVTKSGKTIKVLISIDKISVNSQDYMISTIIDITERKKAEQEIENIKSYFETLTTAVLSGIIVVNSDTHEIVDANPAALNLIGATKEEVVGKVCHKFICPAEIGNCPITDLGQTVDKADRTIITANGERHPVIKSVVKAKHKDRTLLVENFVDISALKKVEASLQKNQKRLELMNEKLRVVGGLTRHDVRNKLSAINGYAYLMKKKHKDQVDIAADLDKMGQSVKEIERIFDFARFYEQLGVEELVFVNVGNAVDEAKALFSCPIPTIVNGCHALSVLADSFLRQMFYNFIDNTRKYGTTATTIKVHFDEIDEGHLKLTYEDDGAGISLENKQRLFREGFSTGGSTGFGLFLIKKMMEIYGWAIEETGEMGKGARFQITIPKYSTNGRENYQIVKKEPKQVIEFFTKQQTASYATEGLHKSSVS